MLRRDLFKLGAGLFGAAATAGAWGEAAAENAALGGATRCIVVWLNGGPSHIDTFDPKPGAEGAAKAIKTAAKGVLLSEHFPALAAHMDKVALVRGLSGKEGNHQRAQEVGHTGHTPNPTVKAPGLGGWITRARAPESLAIPANVALGGPGWSAGFLGRGYDPYVVQRPGERPDDVAPVRPLSATRSELRSAFVDTLDRDFAARTRDGRVSERQALIARARRMMKSPELAAFDLSSEAEATRASYGDSDFGRGCLTARRLIETGVPFVEVALDGWDTHEDNADRVKERAGLLDAGLSGLIADLSSRALLERTVVLCLGEFGRTPRLNGRDGRDHHPAAWSALACGGPIRGGVVHGATDATGEKVVEGKVSVADLLATVAWACGVDPNTSETTALGRPISVTEHGAPIRAILTA